MDSTAILESNGTPCSAHQERDEVFWTELEIRRIGNVVAEGIHAKRYVGKSSAAVEERKRIRKYIDAMRKKCLRVLHRAELVASIPGTAWPGLDPAITDPVSLAEQYVRAVENYESAFLEEEQKSRQENPTTDSFLKSTVNGIDYEDAWEKADEISYREALERDKKFRKSEEVERKELLGETDGGLRRRRNVDGRSAADTSDITETFSKADEELMAKHQPIEDQLTSDLIEMVGRLKGSVSSINEKINNDNKVIDETEDAVDKNLAGISRQQENLLQYSQSTSLSWKFLITLIGIVLSVFLVVFLVISVPV